MLLVAGLTIATIGFLALLGWLIDTPNLTAWKPGTLPMAPSTAILAMLFGGAFSLNTRVSPSFITLLLSKLLVRLGAILALLLFILRLLHIYLPEEYLGLHITDKLADTPLGFISPITALCFLLANGVLLVPLSRNPWRGYVISGLASLITLLSFTLLLGYCYGIPLLIENTKIHPALNTSVILLLMGMGLQIFAYRHSTWQTAVTETNLLPYSLAFLTFTIAVFTIAYQSYRGIELRIRSEVELQLLSVSELKMRELTQWRIERLGDGALTQSAIISSSVARYLETPNNLLTQQELQDWFDSYLRHLGYDQIILFDTQTVTRLSSPINRLPDIASVLKQTAIISMRSKQIMLQDFYRDEHDQNVYMALIVPILDKPNNLKPLGAIVLRIDPTVYLYPLINRWPTPSSSAETLLVRRDDNDALFLNDIRFDKDSALQLRIPLSYNHKIPAVKAVLGERGIVDGKDYRGEPVIAALNAIPNSPWQLVTRIDKKEVYAPLYERMWLTSLLASILILGMGFVLFMLWRQQRLVLKKKLLKASLAELNSNALHSGILHTVMDGFLLMDRHGNLLEVNKTYILMSGYSEQELLSMNIADLEAIETASEIFIHLPNTITQSVNRFETRHRRKDGSNFDVEISLQFLPIDDGRFVIFLQDITERKLTELALCNSNAFSLEILDSIAAEIAVLDSDGVIILVNRQWQAFASENAIAQGISSPRTGVGVNYLEICYASVTSEPNDIALTMIEGINDVLSGKSSSFTQEYPCDSPLQTRWFSMIVTQLESPGKGAVISHVNITDRKLAEEKLRLSSSVFAHAWEGILITTTDGTIVDVNDAFSRITGFSRDEVLGENPRILGAGTQNNSFYTELWTSLIEKGHWYGEIWNRHKDGGLYAVIETISVVRNSLGIPRHYVAMLTDITHLKEHENELLHIAHYDALTSLPNRNLLADRMRQAMAQVQRRNQSMAVVFLDLDGFKQINDKNGHEAGDRLLIAVATRMEQALREGDTLARIGGDEFVAILLDLDSESTIIHLLNRLLAAASESVSFGDLNLQVTASLGVTFYPLEEDIDADQLLRQADQAMYQAKLTGKNRYHIFDAALDNNIRIRHESLDRIRVAMIEQEFILLYQPKVNMRTGAIIGAEALIRWQHPQKGLLLPMSFLTTIEDHPMAVRIGEWVIDMALTQIALWRKQGLDIPVSVNIGARQLQQTDFIVRLREILAAHPDISPSYLELEVLETNALEDLAMASNLIEACRKIGVNFALDDFGTGYSSLNYLKRLPVTCLKIDQSFVRNMLDDPDDLAIIAGVVGLASTFHRHVIAEGVETIEHGTMLLKLGCELAQGYGIARPMPADQLPDWSTTWRPDPIWTCQIQISRDNLPGLFASVEQRHWIASIEAFLKNERELPIELDPEQSYFGMWINAAHQVNPDSQPTLNIIDSVHHQIQMLSTELCKLHEARRKSEALTRLDELHGLRDTFIDLLDKYS